MTEDLQPQVDAYAYGQTAGPPGSAGQYARLSVEYEETSGCIMVYDYRGFLTSVVTPDSLWSTIRAEAERPGTLRKRLHESWTQRRAIGAHEAQAMLEAEKAAAVRRFDARGKPKLTLADLDL